MKSVNFRLNRIDYTLNSNILASEHNEHIDWNFFSVSAEKKLKTFNGIFTLLGEETHPCTPSKHCDQRD